MTCKLAGLIVMALLASCDTRPQGVAHTENGVATTEETWSVRLASGLVVRVKPEVFPVREGPTTFIIELDPPPAKSTAVSIDLVSPTMPAHGITRYDASHESRGRLRAQAEIPMAGDWELYVNLDDGETAALFSFQAVTATYSAGTAHNRNDHTRSSDAGSGTHPTTRGR